MNRTVIIISAIAAIICMCCACLVSVGAYFMNQNSQNVMSNAEKMADFELPAGYNPTVSFSTENYTMAMFISINLDNPILMLMEIEQANINIDDPETQKLLQKQIERVMEGQSDEITGPMTVVKTYQRQIRGKSAIVTIMEGESDTTGTPKRRLLTFFEGKSGLVMVIFQGNQSSWDQDMIDTFLDSIK